MKFSRGRRDGRGREREDEAETANWDSAGEHRGSRLSLPSGWAEFRESSPPSLLLSMRGGRCGCAYVRCRFYVVELLSWRLVAD
ncbi:Hypothetical protein NTJ_08639 [Nesidiocoris tenuis]|uniref:Uncharacterized protein n=1 Tax=Nesidiocoris tenuis TaxID=355587 RepID=A0ABN7AUH0_9HEMI|nr:Hypothetical protein NTJ_08639 [Nesidiocoris tenuis]